MRPVILLAFLAAIAGTGCPRPSRDHAHDPAAPATAPQAAEDRPSEGRPSKQEVLDYLDGKEIALVEGERRLGHELPKSAPRHVVRKAHIEALKVGNGASVNGGPWSTDIDFLLNTGEARYAVLATVSHKRIEDRRAFFGFEIKRVARQ